MRAAPAIRQQRLQRTCPPTAHLTHGAETGCACWCAAPILTNPVSIVVALYGRSSTRLSAAASAWRPAPAGLPVMRPLPLGAAHHLLHQRRTPPVGQRLQCPPCGLCSHACAPRRLGMEHTRRCAGCRCSLFRPRGLRTSGQAGKNCSCGHVNCAMDAGDRCSPTE